MKCDHCKKEKSDVKGLDLYLPQVKNGTIIHLFFCSECKNKLDAKILELTISFASFRFIWLKLKSSIFRRDVALMLIGALIGFLLTVLLPRI